MKKCELDNFIIKYDGNVSYLDSIIKILNNDTLKILKWFSIKKLKEKKVVVIWTNRDKYKEHIEKYDKFRDWMCADTFDGNINLLDIKEARKSEEHKDMDLDEFVTNIIHEFVHACQQEINSDSINLAWFWESMATNLSGQTFDMVDLSKCNFDKLKKDFNGYDNGSGIGYNYAYMLGKYLFSNYEDKLLEFVKSPDKLRNIQDGIFIEACAFYKSCVQLYD